MVTVNLPNGFESWHETHFEVVQHLVRTSDIENSLAFRTMENEGSGGLYLLAKTLTDQFESIHKGRTWDGDFFDEIELFLESKV